MDEEDIKVRQAFLKAIAEVKAKQAKREKREYEAWLRQRAEKEKERMEHDTSDKKSEDK